MLTLQVTCMGKLMETAEQLNVSIKKGFLKGDALVKISLVRYKVDLRETGYFLTNTVKEDGTET